MSDCEHACLTIGARYLIFNGAQSRKNKNKTAMNS